MTTNPALNQQALYNKSRVYIRRGFRAQMEGNAEEYQLWASLAIELLGKAALAKIHPALIADPTHYQSIFAACDRQISPDIKTISAKTLFERLGHLDKSFDTRYQKFCAQMALRRNSELHSGEAPFLGMSPDAWEREFWGSVETILNIQQEDLQSWLGTKDAKTPIKIIQQTSEALQWAVKNRISRSKEDFIKNFPNPKKRDQLIKASENYRSKDFSDEIDLWNNDKFERHICPACSSKGFLMGVLWTEEVSSEIDPEDPTVELVDKIYTTEGFFCPNCHFKLSGTREIQSAELPEEFIETEERERVFEPEYGND